MSTFVFATNNRHKLDEIVELTDNKFDIQTLNEIGCFDDIPETGDTLEVNALMKARFVYQNYNKNCFADDTGLEIESLNFAPGVFSARYAGLDKDPEANMNKVLKELAECENRKARFRTIITLIIDGKEYLFEGKIEGEILTEKKGCAGFGYDPIFKPQNYDISFAEMGLELKNQISHRALAVNKLITFLNNLN
jgi:XTP/dITP diphosphohydrolase